MRFPTILRTFFTGRFSKLLMAVIAFLFAYLFSFQVSESSSPNTNRFEKDLHERESKLAAALDSFTVYADNVPAEKVFRDHLSQWNSSFKAYGAVLLLYQKDTLKFWSDNSAAVENYMKEVCLDERMVRLKNGWYEVVQKPDQHGHIFIGLLLVRTEYPYENQYLVNKFWNDEKLPPETDLVVSDPSAATSIHSSDGAYLFSLVFKSSGQPETPQWQTWLNILFNLAGFVFVLLFIQSESELLISAIGEFRALLLFIGSVVLLRFLSIRIHFPSTFYDLTFFGPKYYGDADSFWLSNLGDFLINAVLLLYLAVYALKHLRKRKIERQRKKLTNFCIALFLLLLPAQCSWAINGMISGLVKNSDIPFNLNNIFSLNIYSYVSLLLIALLLATFFLITDRCVRWMQQIISKKQFLYSIFILAGCIHVVLLHITGSVDMINDLWPFAVILLLLAWRNANESTYSFSLIVCLVFILAGYTTHILLKQSLFKEHDSRKLFAEKLAAEHDPIGEHIFTEFEDKLAHDTLLVRYTRPATQDYSAFEKRVQQQYFSGYWDKYNVKVTFFDTMCTPLLHSASSYSDNITRFDELIDKQGTPTFSKSFFYINNNSGRINYLARIVLQTPGHETALGQGTLIVELDSKLMSEEIGFPELLLDRELGINQDLVDYSYAKYKNGELLNHAGKYQFPLSPDYFGKQSGQDNFIARDGWDNLIYRPDANTVVVLTKAEEGWLGVTTNFSYVFALFSLVLIIGLSVRQLINVGPTFSNLSFKYRIQLVLVIIVLVSLALFGGGSIYFIRHQYQAKNTDIISEKAHSVALQIEDKLQDDKLTPAYKDYATYLLKKFSNIFFTDINLYDLNGNLYASSQPKVFDEGLVSKKMNPLAYLRISVENNSEFIHDENIGNLNYLSAYLPIKNKDGQLQAYLNLPYFSKQSDLEKEISSFLVALINVYVLLFALSVLAAIFTSNYLTHPLRLVQEKMRQVKLGKTNDPIEWKNRDEIGSLVSEYNRMIDELANSAELLAQSERESAWREMAKQVAHEIKNPLTPMRLSIQLLQRAYADKAPDIDQKVERLSKTMMEQIDTLSSIASAFSDFAKMPKPNNEKMDLRAMLQNAIDLFHETSEEVDFAFNDNNFTHAWINADKEQLLRVFNNLFRNAIQAIPEDRKGRIEVTLSKQQNKFIVAVKDNGTGIADEVIDKIFVPNFTTKTAGMGLGLAMVKNILESCNAHIWFETAKGIGSTFYVSLPEFEE